MHIIPKPLDYEYSNVKEPVADDVEDRETSDKGTFKVTGLKIFYREHKVVDQFMRA